MPFSAIIRKNVHTNTNRILTAVVLVAGLLPLLSSAFVFPDEKREAERAYRIAIDDASAEYQRTRSLPALKRRYEAELRETQERLPVLMREKRAVRLAMAQLRDSLAAVQERFGWHAAAGDTENTLPPQDFIEAFRHLWRIETLPGLGEHGRSFYRRLLVAPFGEVIAEDLQSDILRSMLFARVQMEEQQNQLDILETQHTALSADVLHLLAQEERAARGLKSASAQLQNIQATLEEVHAQVLKMQDSLARIDARIRSRIERELLDKGLLTPGVIDRTAVPVTPRFTWPAYGPLSAGFRDAAYQEHFGIPHHGLDIVIAQGTPVFSAADGVVFLARDGGATGYSYVLVGHRGGLATLYGHLSQIAVTSGQDLRQGEYIGLSGGAVGAYGSGPTTTGPHLHFEVIKEGTNIDPKIALP